MTGQLTQASLDYVLGDAPDEWGFEHFEVSRIGSRYSRVERERAYEFVKEHHYSGGMGNAPILFQCMQANTGELVGVIAFHTPTSENVRASVFGAEHVDSVTELHRMAIHPDAPKNTASWFISRALDGLKDYKPQYRAALAYADRTEGHDGTVYQACSADYAGTTAKTTFYRDKDGRLRSPRQCGENISPDEAQERGWSVERRDSKHRYVFWLPDPYQSKDDLREASDLNLQPYPASGSNA